MELLNALNDYPGKTVAYTGTAGSTSNWAPGPQGVVVWATTPCYVDIGTNVTATTSSTPIPANTLIPFAVPPSVISSGAPWRVSAIQISTGGSVYARPINIR